MESFECQVCGDRFETDLEQCQICGGEVVQIQTREQDSRDRENWMDERLSVAYSEIASKSEEMSAMRNEIDMWRRIDLDELEFILAETVECGIPDNVYERKLQRQIDLIQDIKRMRGKK